MRIMRIYFEWNPAWSTGRVPTNEKQKQCQRGYGGTTMKDGWDVNIQKHKKRSSKEGRGRERATSIDQVGNEKEAKTRKGRGGGGMDSSSEGKEKEDKERCSIVGKRKGIRGRKNGGGWNPQRKKKKKKKGRSKDTKKCGKRGGREKKGRVEGDR